MNKINAAFSFGGPPLAIQTIEQLTRVRIDHFAVIDFAGFQQMTDAAGGIDINVGTATERDGVVVPAGPQHLNGAQALVYVRERKSLPGGDFDRVRRRAERAARPGELRALVGHALQPHPRLRPGELRDPARRRRRLADEHRPRRAGLRAARPAGLEHRLPHGAHHRPGMEGSQSVVYLDRQADQDLWFAVNTDKVQHGRTRGRTSGSPRPRAERRVPARDPTLRGWSTTS